MLNQVLKYCSDVETGNRNAGKLEKLAIARFRSDIEKANEKGFVLNEKQGTKSILFFEKWINHSKGVQFAGKPFILEGWQKFLIFNLFAWELKNGRRRFSQAYVEVAKKNGKSPLGAGIGLIKLFLEQEERAEVYSVATSVDQAKIVWDEAKNMVLKSPELSQVIQTAAHSIYVEKKGSIFKPLSKVANNFEGKGPNCVIVDEYHAHKTSLLYDNTRSAMANRINPLTFIITTAGFEKESPCFRFRETGVKILENVLIDESLFVLIFSIDQNDDWENPAVWEKANPNMDVSVNLDFLQSEYISAKNNPDKLVPFLTKHLNVWTDAANVWIDAKEWSKNIIEKIDLTGRKCYGGLDLAAISDANALSLIFPMGEINVILFYYWMPVKAVEKKGHGNYDVWVRDGHIKTTPGAVIDYAVIVRDIIELSKTYKIESIAYDRWHVNSIINGLKDENITLLEHGQGYKDMTPPTKEFAKQTFSGELKHFGDPVTKWMLSNVAIQMDAAGGEKPAKDKSSNKIDGIVAGIMALGNMIKIDEFNTYNERGMLII